MQAEVLLGVFLGVVHHLGEPRAGDHEGGTRHQAFFEAFDGGEIGRVAHAAVVAVDDEELGVSRVAQADGQRGFGPGGGFGPGQPAG